MTASRALPAALLVVLPARDTSLTLAFPLRTTTPHTLTHSHPPQHCRRILLARYGNAATAAAVVGIGGTVVNMH